MTNKLSNILVSAEQVGKALERMFQYVFGIPSEGLRMIIFKDFEERGLLARDVLKADFWIIEAYDYSYCSDNPVGFRTAYNLAGSISCLLLFSIPPFEGFPPEGPFWWSLTSTTNLIEKIRGAWGCIPKKEEFKELTEKWPQLLKTFSSHH